jgi:hypothetical protein
MVQENLHFLCLVSSLKIVSLPSSYGAKNYISMVANSSDGSCGASSIRSFGTDVGSSVVVGIPYSGTDVGSCVSNHYMPVDLLHLL